MGCGCKKNKAQPPAEPNIEYSINGETNYQRLGLRTFFSLPVRLPRAINGRDVIVVQDKHQIPAKNQGALIIIGRNAEIKTADRQQLIEKWPKAFDAV